jgi:hypothetical protein
MSGAFLDRLRSSNKMSLKIAEVYAAFRQAHPEIASLGEFHQRVLDALVALEKEKHLSLPRKSGWDRSVHPWMPRTVSFGRREAPQVREAVAWTPLLAFAAGVTRRTTHVDLVAVNDWLARRGDTRRPTVPTQERSLEIFGDEKRLDLIRSGTALFGGRLTLADLDCAVADPPLGHERGPRPGPILVVENLASFDSFCCHNADPASGHPFGAIAWGAGKSFQKSWSRLEEIARQAQTEVILYLGDIDPHGMDILAGAAAQAWARGISLRPHVGFYEWLLANGPRLPIKREDETEPGDRAAAPADLPRCVIVPGWLFPPAVGEGIAELLRSACRIPQEAFGLEALRRFPAERLARPAGRDA